MPFIDDDLLWCPDNDGKMVDLTQCLDNNSSLGELSHSDLTGLGLEVEEEEEEDIFKQLDTNFELEQFFDFTEEKEENNNSLIISVANKNPASATVTLLQEIHRNAVHARKFNIAASNPLLAGSDQIDDADGTSFELKIIHYKQRYNWDCGVSCVLMVLPLCHRAAFIDNFTEICNAEEFCQSTWSIDLCYLLHRFGVEHIFCSTTLGIHPGFKDLRFYESLMHTDEERVKGRFEEAFDNNIVIRKESLDVETLIGHMRECGPVIVLTNAHMLRCSDCWNLTSKLLRWKPGKVPYYGHYILLCGYNLITNQILYRNPSYTDRVCSMSFSALDEARRCYGTDEDVILIYSSPD